jgi:hypothetical protein
MIAVRPAITKIPSGIPTPSPILLVSLNPDEAADADAELPAGLSVGVETCDMVEEVEIEEVDVDVDMDVDVVDIEDNEEVLVLDWLVVAGRLATVCPTSFKNTPVPSSQQLGNLSQQ